MTFIYDCRDKHRLNRQAMRNRELFAMLVEDPLMKKDDTLKQLSPLLPVQNTHERVEAENEELSADTSAKGKSGRDSQFSIEDVIKFYQSLLHKIPTFQLPELPPSSPSSSSIKINSEGNQVSSSEMHHDVGDNLNMVDDITIAYPHTPPPSINRQNFPNLPTREGDVTSNRMKNSYNTYPLFEDNSSLFESYEEFQTIYHELIDNIRHNITATEVVVKRIMADYNHLYRYQRDVNRILMTFRNADKNTDSVALLPFTSSPTIDIVSIDQLNGNQLSVPPLDKKAHHLIPTAEPDIYRSVVNKDKRHDIIHMGVIDNGNKTRVGSIPKVGVAKQSTEGTIDQIDADSDNHNIKNYNVVDESIMEVSITDPRFKPTILPNMLENMMAKELVGADLKDDIYITSYESERLMRGNNNYNGNRIINSTTLKDKYVFNTTPTTHINIATTNKMSHSHSQSSSEPSPSLRVNWADSPYRQVDNNDGYGDNDYVEDEDENKYQWREKDVYTIDSVDVIAVDMDRTNKDSTARRMYEFAGYAEDYHDGDGDVIGDDDRDVIGDDDGDVIDDGEVSGEEARLVISSLLSLTSVEILALSPYSQSEVLKIRRDLGVKEVEAVEQANHANPLTLFPGSRSYPQVRSETKNSPFIDTPLQPSLRPPLRYKSPIPNPIPLVPKVPVFPQSVNRRPSRPDKN